MLLTLLFATRIAVSSPGTTPQTQPWVSADARQAVAVWVEGGQILLSRIAFDGSLIDTSRRASASLWWIASWLGVGPPGF